MIYVKTTGMPKIILAVEIVVLILLVRLNYWQDDIDASRMFQWCVSILITYLHW